jgi:hypothetical protein
MDYSNHDFYGKDKLGNPGKRRKRWIIAGVAALAIAAAGFLFYEYKTHPEIALRVAEYHEQISEWLAKRKASMHHGIAKVKKQTVHADESGESIHFEFYNTLQEMNSMQADVAAGTQRKLAEAEMKKTAVKLKSAGKPQIHAAKKPNPEKAGGDAAALENELLAAMQQNNGEE